MKPFLKTEQLEKKYQEFGFVKIPFATNSILIELKKLFTEFCLTTNHSDGQVFYSVFSNTLEKNLLLSEKIKKIVLPHLNNYFNDFQLFAPLFLVKLPGNSPLSFHQDWSYLHEQQSPIATLWLPLEETNIHSGCLQVISGSHLWKTNYRSGSLPSSRHSSQEIRSSAMSIETKIGEAIIFHPAIFHGSQPNLGDKSRIVVAMLILPSDKKPMYFHQTHKNKLNCYEMNEALFFEEIDSISQGNPPQNMVLKETITYQHDLPSAEDLFSFLTYR